MLATAGVGFGGASSGQTVAAGGLWETQAAPPLACLLYAASPEGNNSGMPWVLEAVGNLGIGPDDDNPAAHAKPSWLSAYALCPYTDLAEPLLAVLGMDARMRDSVKITASKGRHSLDSFGPHGKRRGHATDGGRDDQRRILRHHGDRRT